MVASSNQGLILPDGTDNANVPLTFTDFVLGTTGMENRLVQRYLSIADRTARNAAPIEGELSHLADLNRYETYTGSAWIPLIQEAVFDDDLVVVSGIVSTVYTTAGGALVGASVNVPNSGQVRVDWTSILDNTLAAGITLVAPGLNQGSVVGAGAVISAPSDSTSTRLTGQDEAQVSSFVIYTGLTPGTAVNAFLNHRVTTGSGSATNRKIAVTQA